MPWCYYSFLEVQKSYDSADHLTTERNQVEERYAHTPAHSRHAYTHDTTLDGAEGGRGAWGSMSMDGGDGSGGARLDDALMAAAASLRPTMLPLDDPTTTNTPPTPTLTQHSNGPPGAVSLTQRAEGSRGTTAAGDAAARRHDDKPPPLAQHTQQSGGPREHSPAVLNNTATDLELQALITASDRRLQARGAASDRGLQARTAPADQRLQAVTASSDQRLQAGAYTRPLFGSTY